jgi:hypothetical protein
MKEIMETARVFVDLLIKKKERRMQKGGPGSGPRPGGGGGSNKELAARMQNLADTHKARAADDALKEKQLTKDVTNAADKIQSVQKEIAEGKKAGASEYQMGRLHNKLFSAIDTHTVLTERRNEATQSRQDNERMVSQARTAAYKAKGK